MFDLYQTVTDKIVAALEAGNIPWVKPWKDGQGYGSESIPFNGFTGNNYKGINILLLGCTAYTSNVWLSFKQAKLLGGSVKKEEKSTMIVFWSRKIKTDKKTGKEKVSFVFMYHNVFNLEQCEGIDPAKVKRPKVGTMQDTTATIVAANHGATVNYGGDRAFFSPMTDSITMPVQDTFQNIEAHDATLYHELTHWTAPKCRLDRDLSGRFGDESYAFEELVAELGSAFLCARVGIEQVTQSSAYIQSWIKVLKGDKTAIYKASKLAQAAADYLLPQNDEAVNDESEDEAA
jgi:antirestriction protein ArdC